MVHVLWLSGEVSHGQKSTSLWLGTQTHNVSILNSKSRYKGHIVREAIESIHSVGLCLSRTWEPLIYCLEECRMPHQQTLGLGC